MGSREYRKIGTETSKGTILLSLTGDLNNPGLVEIPFGMTFRQVIYDLCGGISDGHAFQAALVGGVTGTFITENQLDIRISLDTLKKAGLSLGGGSIVILSDARYIKDVLLQICQFLASETCGKCPSCINAIKTQMDLVKKSKINKLSSEDNRLFKNNRLVLERISVCQMGKSVSNAVGSAFINWPALFF
jgi:NADH-quinone oxidoreductase subunit F